MRRRQPCCRSLVEGVVFGLRRGLEVSWVDALASQRPSTRGDEFCNVKSELLHRGRGSATMTRSDLAPPPLCGVSAGGLIRSGEACVMTGSRSCSSRFELGNDNRLCSLASEPSVRGSWVACHGKSELLAALLPCSATITYGSVMFVLSRVAWVGWPSEVFWLSVVLPFLVNIFLSS